MKRILLIIAIFFWSNCFVYSQTEEILQQYQIPEEIMQEKLSKYQSDEHLKEELTEDEYLRIVNQEYAQEQYLYDNPQAVYDPSTITPRPLCDNGDIEQWFLNGNGWDAAYGKVHDNRVLNSINISGIVYGRHTTMVNGPDPYVSGLNRVHSGDFSLRIGNDVNGAQAELVSKTFIVNSTNTIISFWYAAVLQTPNHGVNENPTFQVRILNSSGVDVTGTRINLGNGSNVIYGQNDPFVKQGAKNGQPFIYREWSCAQIDFSDFSIGDTLSVQFITTDCTRGGHFGYAYIDDICGTCDSNNFDIKLDLNSTDSCGVGNIKIDYTLPSNSTTTGNVVLKLYASQNGSTGILVATSPILSTGSSYTFSNVDASMISGVNCSLQGFDFWIEGQFTLANINVGTLFAGNPSPGFGQKVGYNNDYSCGCENSCCGTLNSVVATRNNDIDVLPTEEQLEEREFFMETMCDDEITVNIDYSCAEECEGDLIMVSTLVRPNGQQTRIVSTGIIGSIDMNQSGNWVLRTLMYCGDTTGEPCDSFLLHIGVFGECDPDPDCCGESELIINSIIADGVSTTPVPCGTVFDNITEGTNIKLTLTPFLCKSQTEEASCDVRYVHSLIRPDGTGVSRYIDKGGIFLYPSDNFDIDTCGLWKSASYVYCDGKLCDSCIIYFDVPCEEDPDCCGESELIINSIIADGVSTTPVPCGTVFDNITEGTNIKLTLTPFLCKSQTEEASCDVRYVHSLIRPDGTGVSRYIDKGGIFLYPSDNFDIDTCGLWKSASYVYCDGKLCDSCIIYFDVPCEEEDCPDECYWKLGGNQNVTATNNIIGTMSTTNPLDWRIFTAGSQKAVVKTNGNVGIGTPNPIHKVDVRGNISAANKDQNNNSHLQSSLLSSDGSLELYRSTSGSSGKINGYVDFKKTASADYDGRLHYNSKLPNGEGFEFVSPQGTTMTIETTNDKNVGIGTNAPDKRLVINSGIVNQSGLRFTNLTSSSPATSTNNKVLTVDNQGNVILVQDKHCCENVTPHEASSELTEKVYQLEEKIQMLEKTIMRLCESGCEGLEMINDENMLYQSIPNPTDDEAIVNYSLKDDYINASITLYGQEGRMIISKELDPKKGKGSLKFTLGDLSSGTYLYSLIIDGEVFDTKRLQIVK